jgi:ribosome-associated protein
LEPKLQSELIVAGAKDNKALKIKLYDVSGKSSLCDRIVICEGRSPAHCRGIAEKIELKMKSLKILPLGIEGQIEGTWILMDYGDTVAHIFHPEIRTYYRLDEIQGEPIGEWNEE